MGFLFIISFLGFTLMVALVAMVCNKWNGWKHSRRLLSRWKKPRGS